MDRFRERAAEAERLAQPSYPAYLWASLRTTSFWQLFQRGMRILRRFRLFSAILRWSAVVICTLSAAITGFRCFAASCPGCGMS